MVALDRTDMPKNGVVKRALSPMRSGDMRTVEHEFTFNRDRTTIRSSTTYALLRQIYERSLDKCVDWCFATNQKEIDLDSIVATYRGRWNIETGFRIQDEATIKSKSKDVHTCFFLFAYEQMLWSVLFREEVSFKGFLIEMSEMASHRLERSEEKKRSGTAH